MEGRRRRSPPDDLEVFNALSPNRITRLMKKCLLTVEAKDACGTDKLCGGMDAGIKVVIHAMHLLCHQYAQEKYWNFLFIDAQNALNEENRLTMLWDVRF